MSFESIVTNFKVLEDLAHQPSETEKYEQTFQDICEKLGELGINTSSFSTHSLPADELSLRFLAMPVHILKAGEQSHDGVRLAVNQLEDNSFAYTKKTLIDDYIIDFESSGVLELHSEIEGEAADNGENTVWKTNFASGPFIDLTEEVSTVYFGKRYESDILTSCKLTRNEVVAERLMDELALFEPGFQDESNEIKFVATE